MKIQLTHDVKRRKREIWMDRCKMISLIKRDNGIYHKKSKLFNSVSSLIGTICLLILIVPVSISILVLDTGKIESINDWSEKYNGNIYKCL